jgi:glycosyltransferase involved in cell wall biosynthesis
MTRIDFLGTNKNAARFRGDASFVYRCENLALALEAAGHRARMQHMNDYRPEDGVDAVVFHRPLDSLKYRRLVKQIKRRGAVVIVDLDDLIFDPDLGVHSPAVVNGVLPLRKIRKRFARHRAALAPVDVVTVSTAAIAEHVRRASPDVRVEPVPNSVHFTWLGESPPPPAPATGQVVITYCPGTRSHDRDFAEIAGALEGFLGEHAEVRLQITGHLEFDLKAREGQVVHAPRVPFSEYAGVVRAGRINLAPLEPSPFNRCKSAIKVIEAGYWNIPTICSPNGDIERFVGSGAVVASTGEEWYGALERLLGEEAYAEQSEGTSERVMALADVRERAEALRRLVEELRG